MKTLTNEIRNKSLLLFGSALIVIALLCAAVLIFSKCTETPGQPGKDGRGIQNMEKLKTENGYWFWFVLTDNTKTDSVFISDGRDGLPGIQGIQGPRGITGDQGPQGEPGQSFSDSLLLEDPDFNSWIGSLISYKLDSAIAAIPENDTVRIPAAMYPRGLKKIIAADTTSFYFWHDFKLIDGRDVDSLLFKVSIGWVDSTTGQTRGMVMWESPLIGKRFDPIRCLLHDIPAKYDIIVMAWAYRRGWKYHSKPYRSLDQDFYIRRVEGL